jgi:hypothetical protein
MLWPDCYPHGADASSSESNISPRNVWFFPRGDDSPMSETLRNVISASSRYKISTFTYTEIFPIWLAQVGTRELPTVPCN